MTGNAFVSFFLRTPLQVFMGNTMLITLTGCKTGRQYSTPVGFYRAGGALWVMTSRDRTWWRNLRHGAPVSLLLNGKTVRAFGELELEENAVQERLRDYIRHTPMAARSLGLRMENKIANTSDLVRVARDRLFVKLTLDSP
jgi:hypothetical protein